MALVLSDQSFPANVPAMDDGECIRVIRVEDGSLQEIVQEFLSMVKKWMIVPGTIIMLGSLSQLGKQGTAWYASEWLRCRQRWASTLANRSNARHRSYIRAPPRPLPTDVCIQSVEICVARGSVSDS